MSLESLSARLAPYAHGLLRMVSGAMFAIHGAQKILGWPPGKTAAFPTQIWVGGMIELVGGLLIALGVFTRCAAFLASGTMAVAYFQFHWKLRWDALEWLPSVNKGEMAVLYCFVFLFLATAGPGALALRRR